MQSSVIKRSIVVAGHKTSVSLEDSFWKALKKIAADRDVTLSNLVASIDTSREHANLSSAIRLFVLDFYRGQLNARIAARMTAGENGLRNPAGAPDRIAPTSDKKTECLGRAFA
jgi:predicted DNA-binding ribbon-helix-helix protein